VNLWWEQNLYLFEKLIKQPMNIVEVIILAVFIYYAVLFLRGTRAVAVLRGALLVFLLYIIAQYFHFATINMLFSSLGQFVVFSLIVMFAPELRRALIVIGRQTVMRRMMGSQTINEPLREAVRDFTNRRTGALIAVERTVGLRGYARSGVTLDSEVTSRTLESIFFPNSPLHDGGVIIENNRILAAACIFPLSSSPIAHIMGTRHRAGLGMSEETDALVVCVSEETGRISIFDNGTWFRDITVTELGERLTQM
jgi:diadenylate cyclase